ncbi:hypothetical protein SAMN06295905_2557 [Devosia lucknowensis]|uniref:Uncharacterized protein n=1 Tax=Devosia lucknowensis TaxID=1096929 RepID=A0A1Y6GBW8_9HYPH|nr:hypothetical protein [Devosia lucknowensis]SMQ85280.1 hypothetical protein SAMN06295905_2557 [Devosia lucknowensis]
MITQTRPILSLTGLLKPEEDKDLELASYDVLLPCRRFDVDHKVAVLGRVSLTAEFLLRLVKSVDGIDENEAALFFGFGLRDMSFVLAEVAGLGYVERREGRLWITLSGMSLFLEGSDEPKIFDVEARRENVGFDLISLAYEHPRGLDDFSRALPELPLLQPERASAAAGNIYSAFRKSYSEIASRRDKASFDKRSLYSIDHVSPGDRFSSSVKLTIKSTGLRPWAGVADLSEWRNEVEQEDRPEVLDAVAAFVDDLSVTQRSGDREAYEVLISLAPEFLKEFVRKSGLAVDQYYRETFNRVGEVRSNRQTIAFVGSLFTRDNVRKLTEAYSIALRSRSRPSTLLWLIPIVKHWGATKTLPELLRMMASRNGADNNSDRPATTVGLVSGWPDAHVKKAFAQVCKSDAPAFPQTLELLIVPGVLVAASIHAPIGSKAGLPVPLGFISFDPRVVERASEYVGHSLHRYVKEDALERRIREDLARTTADEGEMSSSVPE